jgi:hypothetical protein
MVVILNQYKKILIIVLIIMNSNFFHLDNWPIIYIKNKNNFLNDNILEEYKKDYLTILIRCKNNKEKIILFMDIYEKSEIQMPYIKKLTEFHKSIEDYNKLYVEYIYILCKSKIMKNVISMLLSVETPTVPCKIIRSLDKLQSSFLENHSKDIKEFKIYKTLENVMSNDEEDL